MKVVLFCGGLGTRLREYSETIPKPMVSVGNRPILWHLMKYYASFGHKDFILCLGHKSEVVKDYFLNYNECDSNDFTLSNGGREIVVHNKDIEDWNITFAETGPHANLGQRLMSVRKYLEGEEMFLANYSDGLSNVALSTHIDDFAATNAVATFASVRTSQSFHNVVANDAGFVEWIESADKSDIWINGGFFIFRQEIFNYIQDGEELVEEPFARLISDGRLMSYKHQGFWACMDTLKDKTRLDKMFDDGDRPWQMDETGANQVAPAQRKVPLRAANAH